MKNFGIIFLLACVVPLYAQEEPYQPYPCGVGNPKLKDMLKGSVIEESIYVGCYGQGTISRLCSSMLKSGGKPPVMSSVAGMNDEEKAAKKEEFEVKYDAWTCQYSPANLTDNNTATAWAEGVAGDGAGEFVIVLLDPTKKLEIWTGYGKSQALFLQNSRPKKIKLHVVKAKVDYPQCGDLIQKMWFQASSSPVTLRDFNGYQELPPVPVKVVDEENTRYFLGIEILEVYTGTKYKDLCISEVRAAQ